MRGRMRYRFRNTGFARSPTVSLRCQFLVKNKFSGGQAGYHITPKGRAQLLARDDSEFELEVDKAEAMLRMSLGMKARTPSR